MVLGLKYNHTVIVVERKLGDLLDMTLQRLDWRYIGWQLRISHHVMILFRRLKGHVISVIDNNGLGWESC